MTAHVHAIAPEGDPTILAVVRQALSDAPELRKDGPAISAGARKVLGTLLADLDASYLPGGALASIPDCDVAAMIDRLVTDCEEIDIDAAHVDRVDIVWKVKAGASMGAVVLGTCKPVGKRERETHEGSGPVPFWRLTLALDVWCLLTEQERWRLVHHELMHATYKDSGGPAGRCHEIEEFAATLARYGFLGETQAKVIGQAMARDTITEDLRVYDVDPASGQGLLFGADMAAVGW